MDDEEKAFSETPNDPYSLRLTEYLIGRIAALEKRIELLEKKSASPAESGDDLLKELISRSDALDKKLDILIERTADISESSGVEDIGGNSAVQKSDKSEPQTKSTAKGKQVAVFIDGENISHKKAEKIMEKSANRGQIEFARVYGVQNNNSDKCWIKTSGELNIKHIRLAGGSKKNKVDKKMFEEIFNEAKKKDHAETIVIATNDADFVPVVKEVSDMGIHVVIMGLKTSLSDKMKKVCDSFVYL